MAPLSTRALLLPALLALAACSSADEQAKPNPGLQVDWCRLQAPATLETAPGRAIAASGRVRVLGITDATTGTDPDAGLDAKFGWGPHGTVPQDPGEDGAWRWIGASPARDWDGLAAGEPDVDEYRASATAPDVGRYALAFAFSADWGKTWRLCDLGGGPGADGSEDGYAPETAGELVIRSNTDPCFPDPCAVTPVPTCEGDRVVLYLGAGTCTPAGGGYECDYPRTYGTDCGDSDQVCHEGGCVTPVPVDACRHLGPADVTYAGDALSFDGLVRVAGVTDRTAGADLDERLKASFGYGWPGSAPDGRWEWVEGDDVAPPPGWTDEDLPAEQRGADLYRAIFRGAPPGEYDTAWRFSADGGATWTTCDLDGSGGADGPYDPTRAGHLTVPE